MIIVIYDAHILSFAGSQNYCKDACKSYTSQLLYVIVAQLVEHLTFNQRVVGLSPISHTTKTNLTKEGIVKWQLISLEMK